MDGEKKNNSLIFSLFQKYKEAKEQSEKDAAARQRQEDLPLPAEETRETGAVVAAETESRPEFPEEYRYIKSMYELYSYVCDYKTNLEPMDSVRSFEERLYSSIEGHPVYEKHLSAVHHFVEELNLASSVLLNGFMVSKLAATKAQEAVGAAVKSEAADLGTEVKEEKPSEEISHVEELSHVEEQIPVEELPPMEETPPVDAAMHIRNINNGMYALLFVTPPQEGGNDLSFEDCGAVMEASNISYGINQGLLADIIEKNLYMQLFIIAQGSEPVNGIDARIVDKTDCRTSREFRQDEKGKVNFKELDLYEDVAKDQVICELIPAVDGMPGMDIMGKELPFVPGKVLSLKNGKNTIISENGQLLLAAVDGYVSYKQDQYNVEPILTIAENVDYSVGNIDFSGDVVIQGDVRFGFTVKAQGNITVMGMVEGAELIADGDIIIKKGMNGNHSGTLNAKGEVRVSYLENCTVSAGGAVYADSIITCDIYSENSVYLEGSRGIVIGGSVTALRSVEARMIGSKSQRETTIILGETPRIIARKNAIKMELEEIEKVLDKLKLNISYLDKLRGTLPPDKLSILTQLSEQNTLYEMKKADLEKTLLELMRETVDFSSCYIRCNMIFPGTKVVIGADNVMVNTVLSKANIYYDGNEIQIGTI